ncbi:ester cyclase [Acidicapsa ligni]|uniref:ester cyclase n=1 Tax=Acidicapsa ligni TaxID=542300 RepID=UPI0037BF28CF
MAGSLPAASGKKIHFTGITILRLDSGKIVEEVGLDDGVTALRQLGLLSNAQVEDETAESICAKYC